MANASDIRPRPRLNSLGRLPVAQNTSSIGSTPAQRWLVATATYTGRPKNIAGRNSSISTAGRCHTSGRYTSHYSAEVLVGARTAAAHSSHQQHGREHCRLSDAEMSLGRFGYSSAAWAAWTSASVNVSSGLNLRLACHDGSISLNVNSIARHGQQVRHEHSDTDVGGNLITAHQRQRPIIASEVLHLVQWPTARRAAANVIFSGSLMVVLLPEPAA